MAARLGWAGLPPEDAQYFQALATSTGADVWTFDVPPLNYEHNGYFSVIKYDGMGWLDVDRPGLSDGELVRNNDDTVSVWFGDDRVADKPNVIRATEGQKFYYGMRVYRPRDAEETRQFIEKVRSMPLMPVD